MHYGPAYHFEQKCQFRCSSYLIKEPFRNLSHRHLCDQDNIHTNNMFGKSGKYLGYRGTKLQVAVGIIAGMDFLLFGYDQGVTGSLLTLQSFQRHFPTITPSTASNPAEASDRATYQGIAVASYNLGCFCGEFFR